MGSMLLLFTLSSHRLHESITIAHQAFLFAWLSCCYWFLTASIIAFQEIQILQLQHRTELHLFSFPCPTTIHQWTFETDWPNSPSQAETPWSLQNLAFKDIKVWNLPLSHNIFYSHHELLLPLWNLLLCAIMTLGQPLCCPQVWENQLP